MRRLPLRSPPRVRGKDAGCLVHHEKHRITPAYAGKSSRVSSFLWLFWDHPRVCGEKDEAHSCAVGKEGSPPRVRGESKPDEIQP